MDNPKLYSYSIKGRRNTNQDSCIAIKEGNLTFLAVADGMGGASGGEIASQAVIEICEKHIIQGAKQGIKLKNLKLMLDKIFEECQWHLSGIIKKNPALSGMGTTLSCVLLMDNRFVWGNIGDSRVYRFNGSELRQITIDHSLVEEYRKEYGNDIPEFIRSSSNVITRAIGNEKDDPDIFPEEIEFETLHPGEGLLICSDGLIPEKTTDDTAWLTDILLGTKDLKDAAQNMVSTAFDNGSTDNISVVLYEYEKFKRKRKKTRLKPYSLHHGEEGRKSKNHVRFKKPRTSRRSTIRLFLKVTGLFVIMLIGASVYRLFKEQINPASDNLHQITPSEEIRQEETEEVIKPEPERIEPEEPVQPEEHSEIEETTETEEVEPEKIEPEEPGEPEEPVQPELREFRSNSINPTDIS